MTFKPWPLARGYSRLVLLFLLSLAGSAQAQWVWRDAGGEITYSDTPPPADVTRSDILRQPNGAPVAGTGGSDANASGGSGAAPAYSGSGATGGSSPPPPAPAAAPQNAPVNKAEPGAKSLAEQDADFRKRMAEQQKTEQKQAEDESQAAEKASACAQAKGYLDMLQSGTRLLRPDANGDRNFLDDDQRAAEIQKTQDNVAKNC